MHDVDLQPPRNQQRRELASDTARQEPWGPLGPLYKAIEVGPMLLSPPSL